MENYGLALSGGGARGAAHVGVLMALEEAQLLPRHIAGASAGSIVGGLYASGMTVQELREVVGWLQQYGQWYLDVDVRGVASFFSQIFFGKRKGKCFSGLLKGNRLAFYLRELTRGIQLEDAVCGILIPAVDLNSGNTIVYTNLVSSSTSNLNANTMDPLCWETQGNLWEMMMASSSVPGVFQPREWKGYVLVDGGTTNNLPVDLLIEAGVPTVIAVDLGGDYEAPPSYCIMEVISSSFEIMRHDLNECGSRGEVLLLKPKLPSGAGLLSFSYMEACVEAGYTYTKTYISQIRKELLRERKTKNK